MKYELVLFDLDGTLVNTLEAIEKTVNSSLEEMNLKKYPKHKYNELIGYGVEGIVERIFLMEGYDKDAVNPEKMKEKIRKYYALYYNYNVKMYEGIKELLDFMKENNIKSGIVTNKDHELALMTVAKNLPDWEFVDIIGASDGKYPRKPHPYGIEKIAEKTAVAKERILYVGDMEADVKTAENAGVDIVYCNWGFGKMKGETGIPEDIKVENAKEIILKIKGKE